MKPVSSNIKPNNKCLNPVTTKCVTWDGPELTCLDGTVLCKGQSIEVTLYAIATKLCQIIDELGLEGINTCINQVPGGPNVGLGTSPTLQEVFSAIISKVCALNDRVVELEGEECPILTVTVPESSCLRGTINPTYDVTLLPEWDSATNTIPVVPFAEFVATIVCSMLIDITTLQSSVANINQQIEDLWFALDNCANNCNSLVLPTCTYDYTLNEGEPVSVQLAYSWLEKDYCKLKNAIGTPDDIENAVAKQCPDLDNQERLSSGGVMSGISGWIGSPITLADSLNNAWLTICDMREAVSDILNGCCFSLCNYMKVGYDLVWDPLGDYVDLTFNNPSSPVVYSDPNVPPDPTSPFVSIPGGVFPAWVTTVFPGGALNQSNVLLVLNDGTVTVTIDTGQPINYWALISNATSNGYRIDFTNPIFAGYDKTSPNQTINILFTYRVFYNLAYTDCEFNQTDGFVYECCAPTPYSCDAIVTTTGDSGTGLDAVITGVSFPASVPVGVISTGNTTAVGASTLTMAGNPFTSVGGWPALQDYIITVSGGGQTQCRYITNIVAVGPNDVVTVNAAWSTVPAPLPAVVSYVIENQYVDITPLTTGGSTGNACVDALQNFTAKVVEVNSTFNPNDPNTWTVATQNLNVSITDIINQGYQVPEFYLENNKEYAVVLYANYPCGQSDYTILNYDSPILVTVSLQQGTTTSPASAVFAATWSISVYNIISNALAPNRPSTTTGPGGPATFAVDLPVGANLTQFEFAPVQAVWANTQSSPVVPKKFCYCGIAIDPYGSYPVGGQSLTGREYTLGEYRGYSVEYLYKNPSTQAVSPILDSLGNPYFTDTLVDPSLTFSTNVPVGSPFNTQTTNPNPGITPIGTTYPYSTYPFIIRYNPNNYKVDLSPKFHQMTLGDLKIRINNSTSGNINTSDYEFTWHCAVKPWDNSANQYLNVGGTYIMSYTFILPAAALIVGATSADYIVNPGTTCDADYGAAVFQYLTIKKVAGGAINARAAGQILGYTPALASTYSCNVPNTITNITSVGSSGTNFLTAPWLATNTKYIGKNALVTEDYVCTIPNSTIIIDF
jgi:hypothetical protein